MVGRLYETLGIQTNASPEEIRRAYKRRALQTHPDRQPPNISPREKAAAEEQFRLVNNAYEILSHTQKRSAYDAFGVWPPPPQAVEQTRRNRAGKKDVFFNDPVFNDPIFTNPYFGSPYRNSSRTTLFTDPFTLFNSLFEGLGGGDDYLDTKWPYDRYDRDPFRFMSMGFPYGFGTTSRSGFGGHRRYPASALKTTSYQNRSQDGKPAHWVCENTMYRSVNGVTQVVTERRDSNDNTHTYVRYPDGQQTYTINGIEQAIPRQPLEDGPALYEP